MVALVTLILKWRFKKGKKKKIQCSKKKKYEGKKNNEKNKTMEK